MVEVATQLTLSRLVFCTTLLAMIAFHIGTTEAISQQVQQKTAPKKTPAKVGPAAAQSSDNNAPAWVKLCLKNEQTANKQVCLVNHEDLDPNTGTVIVAAAVRSIEGVDKRHLIVRLPTAFSLVMPAGVQIKIDENEPLLLHYAFCFPTSCQVQMELSNEMLEKMRKGKQMTIAAMNMQQKTMSFPVPLTGFSKTSDGPPVDNAQYQNARRKMMEKLRQRQLELSNKAAEAQGKKQSAGESPTTNKPAQSVAPKAAAGKPKSPSAQITD